MPKLQILLHSSKTMVPTNARHSMSQPLFYEQANEIRSYMATLSLADIAKYMKVSLSKAKAVHELYTHHYAPSPSVECFRGDIYSGLRALDFTERERLFAQDHLLILSGLYGALRPYDAIEPYRLEAAYRLPDKRFTSLYSYWCDRLKHCIDPDALLVNVTSKEYEKLLAIDITSRQIAPRFLTRKRPGAAPTSVTVHTKIARGAFARWIISEQTEEPDFKDFNDLGYRYKPELSTFNEPTYVCDRFEGIGLSQRTK